MHKLGFNRFGVIVAAGLISGVFSTSAFADSIAGTLNIAGSISVSSANAGTINFTPLSGGTPGSTFVVIPSTGDFAALDNLDGSESTSLNGIAEPINTPIAPIVGFLTIPTPGPAVLTFDLTEVLGASTSGETPCTLATVSGSCYVAGTPFNFNSGAGGASATFAALGTLNYLGVTVPNVVLQFSATFVGESISTVLNTFLTTGSAVQSSDAELTVLTPEPGTMTMFLAGAGLMAIAALRRRSTSRA